MVWLAISMATAAPLDTWRDEAPLSLQPERILDLVDSADPDADPAILGAHTRLEWQEDGTLRERLHRVYLVRSEETAESWGYVTQSWAPWHETAVRLDARVIAPDGTVTTLDTTSIMEESRTQSNATSYSDGKTRNAPLPGMRSGVVVEEVIEWERRPLVPGVPVSTVMSAWSTVDYPESVVDVLAPRGVDLTISRHGEIPEGRTLRDGQLRGKRLLLPSWDVDEEVPTARPVDQTAIAHAVISIDNTWESTAKAYQQTVEPVLSAADVTSLVDEIRAETSDPAEQIDLAARRVRDDIRYVAMELGANAIIPHAPTQTMNDGFGDCKDKATVLIAVLRALGHDAWMTLINTGPGWDVDPNVPTLGAFDHAIVALQTADGSLRFIDPTDAYTPVTELPFTDQGRRVLVIKDGTTDLQLTPMSSGTDNHWHTTFDLTFAESGYPHSVETAVARGRFATGARDRDRPAHDEWVKEYEEFGEERLGEPVEVLNLAVTGDEAISPEWTRTVTWDQMGYGDATGTETAMWLPFLDEVVWSVPDVLLWEDSDDWSLADRPYGVRIDPFEAVTTWKATVPEGFEVRYVPEDAEQSFGGITYERSVEQQGSQVSVTTRLHADAHVLSVDDAVAFRDWASVQSRSEEWQVQWVDAAYQLYEMGRHYDSIAMRAARPRSTSDRPLNETTLAAQLMDAGFNGLATELATRVTDERPDVAAGWRSRSLAASRSEYGAIGEQFWDADAVYDFVDKSLEIEPEDPSALAMRAAFTLMASEGTSGGLQESIDDFKKLAELGAPGDDTFLIGEFLKREDYAGLRAYAIGRSETPWQVANLTAAWAQTGNIGPADSPDLRGSMAIQLLGAGDVERARQAVDGINTSGMGMMGGVIQLVQGEEASLNTRREPTAAWAAALMALQEGEPLDSVVASSAPDNLDDWLLAETDTLNWDTQTFAKVMSRLPLRAEGSDDVGYRLVADSEITDGTIGYVVRERGHYRLLATPTDPRSVARYAFEQAQAGHDDVARQWLTWFFQQSEQGDRRTDVMATTPAVFLWNRGAATDVSVVAAAALAQLPDTPEDAADVLRRAQASADGDEAVSLALALSFLYREHLTREELHPLMTGVYEAYPNHPFAQSMYVGTAPDIASTEAAVEALSAQSPLDSRVQKAIGDAFADYGDPRVNTWYEPLASQPNADAGIRNNYAWHLATFEPERLDEALRLLRAASRDNWTENGWHTLASLELMAGEPRQAFEAHSRALQLVGDAGLRPEWGPVRAQLLASWGFVDAAREELSRHEQPNEDAADRVWQERAAAAIDAAAQASD